MQNGFETLAEMKGGAAVFFTAEGFVCMSCRRMCR